MTSPPFSSTKILSSSEILPVTEMHRRHEACRTVCQKLYPQAQGMLFFSRLALYYLSGSYADGIFWLPQDGTENDALLLLRQHNPIYAQNILARCRAESPLKHIDTFTRLSELPTLCQEYTLPLGDTLAVEMNQVSWQLAQDLQHALPQYHFLNGEAIFLQARAKKSLWELNKMRIAGARHHEALYNLIPKAIAPGMSEKDIAHISWEIFFQLGHSGINRLGNFGEECFLGHIAAGDNGNYPSHFNGPLGLKGEHPALPYMGHAQSIWQKNQILAMDIGYMLEGYHTDKTQVYFSGKNIPDAIRKAHDACIDIQQRAAEQLKPGVIAAEIWHDAVERAKKWGISQGFMGFGSNKVPFLGHGIGLVIDEYPVLAARFDVPLQEHMTLAIEPKVGLPGLGMVGVENTFVVTPQGGASLSGEQFDIIKIS